MSKNATKDLFDGVLWAFYDEGYFARNDSGGLKGIYDAKDNLVISGEELWRAVRASARSMKQYSVEKLAKIIVWLVVRGYEYGDIKNGAYDSETFDLPQNVALVAGAVEKFERALVMAMVREKRLVISQSELELPDLGEFDELSKDYISDKYEIYRYADSEPVWDEGFAVYTNISLVFTLTELARELNRDVSASFLDWVVEKTGWDVIEKFFEDRGGWRVVLDYCFDYFNVKPPEFDIHASEYEIYDNGTLLGKIAKSGGDWTARTEAAQQ